MESDIPKGYKAKYGTIWRNEFSALEIEMECVRRKGRWTRKNGDQCGEGMFFHFRALVQLLWPKIVMHRWLDDVIEAYLTHRTIVIMGPASTGKSFNAAVCVLADYYCWPHCTGVLVCSTTKERLEDKVWGEIKSLHRRAKIKHPSLPGYMIEGRQRIVTDTRAATGEARDMRNGLIGVPCKQGGQYTGLGDFAGFKNLRVRMIGDELSLLEPVFVDAISNLDKNPDFKCFGLGNPKDTTDALGRLAEPLDGGWESGIDQTPVTKTWKITRPDGICIQLPGPDSPNLDGKLGIPLITQEAMDRDAAFYRKDSVWFTMMNLGCMPRGHGLKRVITRQSCVKFGAFDEPDWKDSQQTTIAFLDAAYSGVGGDRCVFGLLKFGEEAVSQDLGIVVATNVLNQNQPNAKRRQIVALSGTEVVPVNPLLKELPADQIVKFVMDKCNALGIPPENFYFDAGMRTSLVTAFCRIWSNAINSVDCGGKASETTVSAEIPTLCRDYYFNFITELWYSVRLAIEAGQFRGMTEDVCMEFSQREWDIVSGNKIQVEPKKEMKERTGRSPDLADSVAVGVWGARQRGFIISNMASLNKTRKRVGLPDWRDEIRREAKEFWDVGALTYT